MRFVGRRHYCFRTYFFSVGADKQQSTISEGCVSTVKTTTCRDWIIRSAYTPTVGWDEAYLEIATLAHSVWMHACQMIHHTWGKGFISKSSTLGFDFAVFFLFLKTPAAVNGDFARGGKTKGALSPGRSLPALWDFSWKHKLQKYHCVFMEERDCLVSWKLKQY